MGLAEESIYISIDEEVVFVFLKHHLTPHVKVLFRSINNFTYKEMAYIFLDSENGISSNGP
uniref:Uncharacterized protein n=1 Tax=Arundo donax TaxID=35708 RepID=A0A0A9SAH7_ARUDO